MSINHLIKAEYYKFNIRVVATPLLFFLMFLSYMIYLLIVSPNNLLVDEIKESSTAMLPSILFLSDWSALFLIFVCFILAANVFNQEKNADSYLLYRMKGVKIWQAVTLKYFYLLTIYLGIMLILLVGYVSLYGLFAYTNSTSFGKFLIAPVGSLFFQFFIISLCVLNLAFGVAALINDTFKIMLCSLVFLIASSTISYLGEGYMTPFTIPSYYYNLQNLYTEGFQWVNPLSERAFILNFAFSILIAVLGCYVFQRRCNTV